MARASGNQPSRLIGVGPNVTATESPTWLDCRLGVQVRVEHDGHGGDGRVRPVVFAG